MGDKYEMIVDARDFKRLQVKNKIMRNALESIKGLKEVVDSPDYEDCVEYCDEALKAINEIERGENEDI